ncbi:MAG: hypothetical protein IJY16_05530 [Clostridia bacterium]|nr:hypothetical protein [Clostridia bacterium]
MKYTSLKYQKYMEISKGQDGAIYNGLLFRFDSAGHCYVYDLAKKELVSEFTLDRVEDFSPHSNAVFFGTEKYDEQDEFPLLYTNLYNNYVKMEDRREGVLCAYRIMRDGLAFSTRLVQIIRIGFVEELDLWKSLENNGDVRPYGNFILNPETGKLYAFVMRDKEQITRYFEFDMPTLSAGEPCPACGIPVVWLKREMITAQFDGSYSHCIQGACLYDGLLFSVEGFTVKDSDPKRPPRMQIMNVQTRKQIGDIPLHRLGLLNEPEFIYPYEGTLYYADCYGQLYTVYLG